MANPEEPAIVVLVVMLVASLSLALLDFDTDFAVNAARAVCVVLAILLTAGIMIPVRRRLQRERDERSRREDQSETSS